MLNGKPMIEAATDAQKDSVSRYIPTKAAAASVSAFPPTPLDIYKVTSVKSDQHISPGCNRATRLLGIAYILRMTRYALPLISRPDGDCKL